MARGIPDPLKRRHLVESEIDGGKAQAIADAYLEADQVLDALAFLQRAGATERLRERLAEAVREGDVFQLRAVSEALGQEPEKHHWKDAAEAAKRLGKDRYAAEAQAQVERLGG